jgi:hypothetical protein
VENPIEIVPDNVSDSDLRDEVLRRNSRAGYCTRAGDPMDRTKILVTSGIGETKLNVWPRDEHGNLID